MGQAIDPEGLRAWRAFLEAHAAVLETLEGELRRECDLPLSWYDVLLHLSEAPGRRLRLQELGRRVLLTQSGISRLVDRMAARGLVAREAVRADRRGTYAVLTPAGRGELRRAAPVHLRGVDRHFLQLLTAEEVRVLGRALGRVLETVRNRRLGAGTSRSR